MIINDINNNLLFINKYFKSFLIMFFIYKFYVYIFFNYKNK